MNLHLRTTGLAAAWSFFALLACLLLMGTTIGRNAVYHAPVTLWSVTVSSSPGKARPHYNLGNAFRDQGDLDRAVAEWRRTIEIDPRYSMAYNQLGNVQLLSGSLVAAERYYVLAVSSDPNNAEAHYNLALVSESLGMRSQAIEHYDQFLGRSGGQSAESLQDAASRLRRLRNP